MFADFFFSLRDYSHQEIFAYSSYVWEALVHLETYLKRAKLGKIECEVPSTAHLVNASSISIGKGTVIEPGAYIQGPCIIGSHCSIRHGAYIRNGVITGDRCVIGHDTEVKSSILLNQVRIAHFNYVGDSILGNKVNLGAGVKCSNLRLDGEEVSIFYGEEKIFTRLRKLGLIAGDGTQLGCNCVTNPGTFLGKNVICHPCLNIGGYVPSECKIKPAHKNFIIEKSIAVL